MKLKESKMTKRPEKARDILIVLVVFVVALIAFLVLVVNVDLTDTNMRFYDRYEAVGDDWLLTTRQGTDIVVDLPVWVDVPPGGTVSLTHRIPSMDSPSYTFVTRNYHNKLTAYLNDSLIYEFPSSANGMSSSILTDDWNSIRVPQSSIGENFTVEFSVGSSGYHGYINPLFFGEDNAIFAHLRSEYKIPYALGISLIAIGLLLILVSTIYTKNFSERKHFLLGFIFIALGLWFSDRSHMPVFMVGSNMKFFLVFSVLNLVPLLVVLYTGERFKNHNQVVINCMTITAIAFDLILFALASVGRASLHTLVPYVYVGILVVLLYTLYLMTYYAFGRGRLLFNRVQLNATRLEFLSAIILIGMIIGGLVWDAVSTDNWSATHRDWTSVGTLHVLAVVAFAFFHFVILVYNSYYSALESEATQKLLHDSQLQLMMSQIQPHFMFNTLSSIRTLIKIDPDVAYDMVYNFSNYLRANVDNLTNLNGIPFSSEVQHIQSYVEIEKVRFGDRLNVEYDIQESEFLVPPLSIQPLVENAIKHGVCKRPEGGTVILRSYAEPANYIIEIEDDGVGIPPERLASILGNGEGYFGDALGIGGAREVNLTGNGSEEHQSTGMKNIIMRLDEMCKAELKIQSEVGKGTLTKVVIPKL